MSRVDEKPKRGLTNAGRRVHAFYGARPPARAMCGAEVVLVWPATNASGEKRFDYWGMDPDSCRTCLRELRREAYAALGLVPA